MTGPIDYGSRAGHNPQPAGFVHDWTDAHHTPEAAQAFTAANGRIFWADIAEFQSLVSAVYPWQQLAIRLDNGFRLDFHAQDNYARWHALKRGPLIGYGVFVPGQSANIQKRLKNYFGSEPQLAFCDDMESGTQFAGPGNHSAEANDHAAWAAQWTGSYARSVGYANDSDWADNWPNRPKWMKRITAAYGKIEPSTWGWQYYGGLDYPTRPGFPRAVAPFGGWVDINTAPLTVDGFAASLDLGDWFSMATPAELQKAVLDALASDTGQALIKKGVRDYFLGSDNRPHTIESAVAHVTQAMRYKTHKGHAWPALARLVGQRPVKASTLAGASGPDEETEELEPEEPQ